MWNKSFRGDIEAGKKANPGKVYISKGGTYYHWPGCPIASTGSYKDNPEAFDYFLINESELPKARTRSGRRFIMCPLCHSSEELDKERF